MENLIQNNNNNNGNNNTNKLYYSTPFIYPIWGLQKIFKNYEREMFLYEYKNINLDKDLNDIEEILYDENNKFKGIKTTKGETIYGKILLSSPEYMIKFNKIENKRKILRRIIIANITYLNQIPKEDSCQIIIPKKQTGMKDDIYILRSSYGHCISRKGFCVFFMSCWDDGRNFDLQLKPAMDVLEINKNIVDIFDMKCDYYEPIDKNFGDNIFISNSFLPQSHFEDDFDDIINEFGKITDAKLQFDKLKNNK